MAQGCRGARYMAQGCRGARYMAQGCTPSYYLGKQAGSTVWKPEICGGVQAVCSDGSVALQGVPSGTSRQQQSRHSAVQVPHQLAHIASS